MGPLFAFRIDRCLVYTGKINKDFLHWDFILSLVLNIVLLLQQNQENIKFVYRRCYGAMKSAVKIIIYIVRLYMDFLVRFVFLFWFSIANVGACSLLIINQFHRNFNEFSSCLSEPFGTMIVNPPSPPPKKNQQKWQRKLIEIAHEYTTPQNQRYHTIFNKLNYELKQYCRI